MPNQDDQEEEEGKECCADVLDCVCVFCVLLLQTATLNVLGQTAQFQHLQSPKTEHPKQRFFFPFCTSKVPTYIFFLHLLWVLQFAHWVLLTFFSKYKLYFTPAYAHTYLPTHLPYYP